MANNNSSFKQGPVANKKQDQYVNFGGLGISQYQPENPTQNMEALA